MSADVAATPSPDSVTIYTDGACLGNPGPGGWAAVLMHRGRVKEISGRFRATTNNRMELRAAIEALDTLTRPCRVILHTDSQYVRQGVTTWIHTWQANGWRTKSREPVKNQDLWQALLNAAARHAPAGGVEWVWVKGHADDRINARVDALATAAARAATDADPVDAEPTDDPVGAARSRLD